MDEPRLRLASFVVVFTMLLFGLAFTVEGFYQVKVSHRYVPPTQFLDVCEKVIGASIFVLTLGSTLGTLAQLRKKTNKDDK